MLRFLKEIFSSSRPESEGAPVEGWRSERALIYPKEAASSEELKLLGERLQAWAAAEKHVHTIVGLEELCAGTFPPAWIGGPVTPEELESNSLCAAVVLAGGASGDLVKRLRDVLPPDLVSAICMPMPWN